MSDMLQKFLAQTKLRADPDLINRWEFHMRHYGDARIKPQTAHARRTETVLRNACHKFQNLSSEQELAFKEAASGMHKLADDLERLGELAKAYFNFCKKEEKIKEAQELESIAFERWGNDVAALQQEVDVVVELSSEEGKRAFERWVHASGWHTNVALGNILPVLDRLTFDDGSLPLRLRMAKTVRENRKVTDDKWRGHNGLCVNCGWEKYESYLAYRKDLASTTNKFLQIVGQGG